MKIGKISPTLNANGVGELKVEPDIAYLYIGVQTKGDSAQVAGSENANLTQKLIDTLTTAGISKKDLKTNNYRVAPEYKTNEETDETTINGYTATNQLNVKVRDIKNVGNIIDVISQAGNYTINGINFDIKNKKRYKYQDEALTKAVLDAHHNAKIAAKAENKSIAGIKNITIGNVSHISPHSMKGFAAVQSARMTTPIEPGELTIQASVSIEYLLDK